MVKNEFIVQRVLLILDYLDYTVRSKSAIIAKIRKESTSIELPRPIIFTVSTLTANLSKINRRFTEEYQIKS